MKGFLKENKILLIILIISFGISLIHSFYFRIQPIVDARAYDNIAVNLINGNGYKEDVNAAPDKDFSIGRVGPGYEFFLAGAYTIFGHHYGIVWILQAIFHVLTALFVFLISKEI
ncbi:MAG: hypothetical protein Q8N69_00980, partial [bacterium]|nr:hypothetical protein [bacterium]